MASYKEIVTKAVIGKGKKTFQNVEEVAVEPTPTTILGCWVINHTFGGTRVGDKIQIDGSYDVNIWYSYDNDSKTDVYKQSNTYQELVNVKKKEDSDFSNEEILIQSLKQPTVTKVEIKDGKVDYTVEKELGVEIVGDAKVKIPIEEEEDPWDDLVDDEEIDQQIDEEVNEDYLEEE